MQLPITSIRVEGRHRQDLGDIDSLAASIQQVGLLHPIVVTPENRLIAGERRLAAAEHLGWREIAVTVAADLDDAVTAIRAERDENVQRKDFTPLEALAIAQRLEPLERQRGQENEEAGRGRPKKGENFTPISDGTSSLDRVAAAVGVSRPTLTKIRAVAEAAEKDPEQFAAVAEEMDRTGKVEPAFRAVEREYQRQTAERESVAAIAPLNLPKIDDAENRRIAITTAFYGALKAITELPPPKELAPMIPEYRRRSIADLPAALAWLTEFAQIWETRQ